MAAGTTEPDANIEEAEVRRARTGKDLIDKGFGHGEAARGDSGGERGVVGGGAVAIAGTEGGPAEEI